MLSKEHLKTGLRLTRPGPPMTLEAFDGFGRLLGTDAPIHNDPAYAAKTPFGKVIAQGPLLLASFETWFSELFGEDTWSRTGQMAAKFVSPAKIGDTVTLELVVGETQDDRVKFEVRVIHDDRLLALGSASLEL